MFQRIWSLIQKEFIQVWREKSMLILLLIAPFLQLVIIASSIHMDIKHIPLIVADQSNDARSRAYLDAMASSGSFDIAAHVASEDEIIRMIDAGQATIGLVIPPDFAARVERGSAQVLLVMDGSNAFTAQSAASAATAIAQQYAIGITQRSVATPLTAHINILYNPALTDLWFMIPGLIANTLQAQTLGLTAMAVVRERERGTIEALLVTPVRPFELMLAKTIPSLAIVACNIITVLVLSTTLFGVPFAGNLGLFIVLCGIYAMCGLGLGLVISTIAQSQTQSMQFTVLITFVAMFLSGFLFPAYALPLPLKVLGYAFPLTSFIPISRGIFLKGVGIPELWGPVLALLGLLVTILFASTKLFRQSLD